MEDTISSELLTLVHVNNLKTALTQERNEKEGLLRDLKALNLERDDLDIEAGVGRVLRDAISVIFNTPENCSLESTLHALSAVVKNAFASVCFCDFFHVLRYHRDDGSFVVSGTTAQEMSVISKEDSVLATSVDEHRIIICDTDDMITSYDRLIVGDDCSSALVAPFNLGDADTSLTMGIVLCWNADISEKDYKLAMAVITSIEPLLQHWYKYNASAGFPLFDRRTKDSTSGTDNALEFIRQYADISQGHAGTNVDLITSPGESFASYEPAGPFSFNHSNVITKILNIVTDTLEGEWGLAFLQEGSEILPFRSRDDFAVVKSDGEVLHSSLAALNGQVRDALFSALSGAHDTTDTEAQEDAVSLSVIHIEDGIDVLRSGLCELLRPTTLEDGDGEHRLQTQYEYFCTLPPSIHNCIILRLMLPCVSGEVGDRVSDSAADVSALIIGRRWRPFSPMANTIRVLARVGDLLSLASEYRSLNAMVSLSEALQTRIVAVLRTQRETSILHDLQLDLERLAQSQGNSDSDDIHNFSRSFIRLTMDAFSALCHDMRETRSTICLFENTDRGFVASRGQRQDDAQFFGHDSSCRIFARENMMGSDDIYVVWEFVDGVFIRLDSRFEIDERNRRSGLRTPVSQTLLNQLISGPFDGSVDSMMTLSSDVIDSDFFSAAGSSQLSRNLNFTLVLVPNDQLKPLPRSIDRLAVVTSDFLRHHGHRVFMPSRFPNPTDLGVAVAPDVLMMIDASSNLRALKNLAIAFRQASPHFIAFPVVFPSSSVPFVVLGSEDDCVVELSHRLSEFIISAVHTDKMVSSCEREGSLWKLQGLGGALYHILAELPPGLAELEAAGCREESLAMLYRYRTRFGHRDFTFVLLASKDVLVSPSCLRRTRKAMDEILGPVDSLVSRIGNTSASTANVHNAIDLFGRAVLRDCQSSIDHLAIYGGKELVRGQPPLYGGAVSSAATAGSGNVAVASVTRGEVLDPAQVGAVGLVNAWVEASRSLLIKEEFPLGALGYVSKAFLLTDAADGDEDVSLTKCGSFDGGVTEKHFSLAESTHAFAEYKKPVFDGDSMDEKPVLALKIFTALSGDLHHVRDRGTLTSPTASVTRGFFVRIDVQVPKGHSLSRDTNEISHFSLATVLLDVNDSSEGVPAIIIDALLTTSRIYGSLLLSALAIKRAYLLLRSVQMTGHEQLLELQRANHIQSSSIGAQTSKFGLVDDFLLAVDALKPFETVNGWNWASSVSVDDMRFFLRDLTMTTNINRAFLEHCIDMLCELGKHEELGYVLQQVSRSAVSSHCPPSIAALREILRSHKRSNHLTHDSGGSEPAIEDFEVFWCLPRDLALTSDARTYADLVGDAVKLEGLSDAETATVREIVDQVISTGRTIYVRDKETVAQNTEPLFLSCTMSTQPTPADISHSVFVPILVSYEDVMAFAESLNLPSPPIKNLAVSDKHGAGQIVAIVYFRNANDVDDVAAITRANFRRFLGEIGGKVLQPIIAKGMMQLSFEEDGAEYKSTSSHALLGKFHTRSPSTTHWTALAEMCSLSEMASEKVQEAMRDGRRSCGDTIESDTDKTLASSLSRALCGSLRCDRASIFIPMSRDSTGVALMYQGVVAKWMHGCLGPGLETVALSAEQLHRATNCTYAGRGSNTKGPSVYSFSLPPLMPVDAMVYTAVAQLSIDASAPFSLPSYAVFESNRRPTNEDLSIFNSLVLIASFMLRSRSLRLAASTFIVSSFTLTSDIELERKRRLLAEFSFSLHNKTFSTSISAATASTSSGNNNNNNKRNTASAVVGSSQYPKPDIPMADIEKELKSLMVKLVGAQATIYALDSSRTGEGSRVDKKMDELAALCLNSKTIVVAEHEGGSISSGGDEIFGWAFVPISTHASALAPEKQKIISEIFGNVRQARLSLAADTSIVITATSNKTISSQRRGLLDLEDLADSSLVLRLAFIDKSSWDDFSDSCAAISAVQSVRGEEREGDIFSKEPSSKDFTLAVARIIRRWIKHFRQVQLLSRRSSGVVSLSHLSLQLNAGIKLVKRSVADGLVHSISSLAAILSLVFANRLSLIDSLRMHWCKGKSKWLTTEIGESVMGTADNAPANSPALASFLSSYKWRDRQETISEVDRLNAILSIQSGFMCCFTDTRHDMRTPERGRMAAANMKTTSLWLRLKRNSKSGEDALIAEINLSSEAKLHISASDLRSQFNPVVISSKEGLGVFRLYEFTGQVVNEPNGEDDNYKKENFWSAELRQFALFRQMLLEVVGMYTMQHSQHISSLVSQFKVRLQHQQLSFLSRCHDALSGVGKKGTIDGNEIHALCRAVQRLFFGKYLLGLHSSMLLCVETESIAQEILYEGRELHLDKSLVEDNITGGRADDATKKRPVAEFKFDCASIQGRLLLYYLRANELNTVLASEIDSILPPPSSEQQHQQLEVDRAHLLDLCASHVRSQEHLIQEREIVMNILRALASRVFDVYRSIHVHKRAVAEYPDRYPWFHQMGEALRMSRENHKLALDKCEELKAEVAILKSSRSSGD